MAAQPGPAVFPTLEVGREAVDALSQEALVAVVLEVGVGLAGDVPDPPLDVGIMHIPLVVFLQ